MSMGEKPQLSRLACCVRDYLRTAEPTAIPAGRGELVQMLLDQLVPHAPVPEPVKRVRLAAAVDELETVGHLAWRTTA